MRRLALRAGLPAPAGRARAAGWLLALAIPVLGLVVDKVASTAFAIFFLAGLWLLARGRVTPAEPATRAVLLAFAAYFLVGLISFLAGEPTRLGEKLLGRDIRFLAAVPVFFALARIALPAELLRLALALGGIAAGVTAILQVALAGPDHRAAGETISIVFGHLSVLLFALNLAVVVGGTRRRGLAFTGAVFALLAAALSGTRGALLSAMVVLALAMGAAMLRGRAARERRAVLGVLLLACALAFAWLLPRLQEGWQEYQAFKRAEQRVRGDTARGCLADAELLRVLIEAGGPGRGVQARVVAAPDGMQAHCAGAAILLENHGDARGYWVGPYRSLPTGAAGRLLVQGRGHVRQADSDVLIRVRAHQAREIALPAVREKEHTRVVFSVPPGERLWVTPVESHPREYAFAATESSIGNRLAMWAAALRNADGGVLGHGTGAWPGVMAEEAAAGRVAWRLSAYDHAHSDYLTVLVERGSLGLAALLAVLLAPLFAAARGAVAAPDLRLGILLLVVATAVSALSETVFNHSIGITYYCALVLLLMTARPHAQRDNAGPPGNLRS